VASARTRYRALFGRGESTERIEFFSDAVFAIAMTLLVLDIRVPDVKGDQVGPALVELIPQIFAYILSFIIIGLQWMSHHRKFRVITGYDGTLVQLNLVLLFFVAFAPFPTSLLAEAPDSLAAVVLYAAVVGAMSLVQYLMWAHARRAGLLAPSVDVGVYRLVSRAILVTPVVFGISIIIALAGAPLVAMFSWFLMVPASIIANRRWGVRDDLAEAASSAGSLG
jgi:uncharacterized membrane protein